jgi:integrase
MIGDKKAAEQVASAIRQKLAKGKFNLDKKKTPTFGQCADKWLNGYIKGMRLESTFERYQEILNNHVLHVLKNKPLDQISRTDVRDLLVSKIGEGYSRSTICVLRDVINGVFNYAIDEEIVLSSPVTGITKRLELKRERKKEIEPLTKEELSLFLNTCNDHYPDYYPFFLMAARTGMRLGELLAVRWGDLDFNSHFVWVRRSYRRGRFSTPKNKKDRRVDMSDQLGQTLKGLLHQRKKEALQKSLGEVPDLIFHRESGQVIKQNYIRRVFKRILKKAELREIRIHDLRHTFASLLLSQGRKPGLREGTAWTFGDSNNG